MTSPLSDARLTEIRVLLGSARSHADADGAITDLLVEIDRLRAHLAAEPPQPSPEHQAIYLDDYDQVWCDYPTVPTGDQVLPLVWASEVAQSRRDLSDGGNRLRVIGWCR